MTQFSRHHKSMSGLKSHPPASWSGALKAPSHGQAASGRPDAKTCQSHAAHKPSTTPAPYIIPEDFWSLKIISSIAWLTEKYEQNSFSTFPRIPIRLSPPQNHHTVSENMKSPAPVTLFLSLLIAAAPVSAREIELEKPSSKLRRFANDVIFRVEAGDRKRYSKQLPEVVVVENVSLS
jgi:hypothetical protein